MKMIFNIVVFGRIENYNKRIEAGRKSQLFPNYLILDGISWSFMLSIYIKIIFLKKCATKHKALGLLGSWLLCMTTTTFNIFWPITNIFIRIKD